MSLVRHPGNRTRIIGQSTRSLVVTSTDLSREVKVKFTLEQVMKTQRSKDTALLFLELLH